jgi:maleate isomerase
MTGIGNISYGGQTRLGVVVPSPNAIMEPELIRLLPPGVTAHFARVGLETVLSEELLERMADELVHECRKLALLRPAAIGYGCTSGSFFRKGDFDERMMRRMTEASGGIPATTATTAALAALRELGAWQIAFVSPYEQGMHTRGVEYFSSQGFAICGDACLGLMEEAAIGQVTSETISELAQRADNPRVEAIFISCTGLPSLGALPALVAERGKPVLASNLTLSWHLLHLTGVLDATTSRSMLTARWR